MKASLKRDFTSLYICDTIFVSGHVYPENSEGTQVIEGYKNMGYDIYPTLQGINLTTSFVPSARRSH